jgi:orotidine-5'-phosphate decarboxylase
MPVSRSFTGGKVAVRNFRDLIERRWSCGLFVCIGLDSDLSRIPESVRVLRAGAIDVAATLLSFNRAIVEATADIVCAYKPNSAFYEMHGSVGMLALEQTVAMINRIAPDVPVILDAKRGDIGSTSSAYAAAAFDALKADALTVSPYLGSEASAPFLDRFDKGIFVLCRTSNRGSGEFQELAIGLGGHKFFLETAYRVAGSWNRNRNCGLVVGATYPNELAEVRRAAPGLPILIPGIGVQGGDLRKAIADGRDTNGRGIIVNSSRGVIFASRGTDFTDAARRETESLNMGISAC